MTFHKVKKWAWTLLLNVLTSKGSVATRASGRNPPAVLMVFPNPGYPGRYIAVLALRIAACVG